jgi:hypothetical protein
MKKKITNNLSQPRLTQLTRNPEHEIEITL